MKNLNKYLNILILIFLPILSYAQDSLKQKEPKLIQLWTLEEVKEMAKKYNLQDSISLTKNSLLLYTKRSSIEKYFQQEAKMIQIHNEFKAYLSKTINVRNFEDLEILLNSYPNVKEAMVKSHGGENNYKKYMSEVYCYSWRIYRNKDGGLAFFRADEEITEHEWNCGQRIYGLPKTN